MAHTYLFFVILLLPLLGLEGAQGPCPTPCRCHLEILNCSRITDPPGFHQVPLPKMVAYPFTYLDFTGNAIFSIGKEVWDAYPWAEYLVLKDNSLSRLQNSSLEGLLSLTYLDLSCNKIQIIEKNAFEAVPFLQIINLKGNLIEEITEGTFQAWHSLQFLLKVDLSHNPLKIIQDPYFYRLPSLKVLDLGATEVMPRTLEDLLQTSLQLKTLVLPKKMSCCLCHIKEDIEVFQKTVKLECTESCDINATLCENEEPLSTIQEVVTKILEIRKWNGSGLLSILTERTIPNNDKPERAEPHKESLMLADNYSSLAANLNLLKSVKQLMQMKADEPLDVNWDDKKELEKLYLLASLLQGALKEKIFELDKIRPQGTVQSGLSDHVLEKTTEEARKRSADTSLKKKRHMRKVKREELLGRNQRPKNTLFRFGRDGQQVAVTATQSADKPSVFESHSEVESWRKLPEGLESQQALPFPTARQVALQSSWKRSVSDSPTNALKPTISTEVNNNDNDFNSLSSGENSVLVLKKILGSQILTKEELLNPLLHRNDHLADDGKSDISADNSKPSLNEHSPDITLSPSPSLEHQRTSVTPMPGFLAREGDKMIQGELFEMKVNKKLTSLIPNTQLRKLVSHVVRILKMDCMAPSFKRACAKLFYRTSLLGKLSSENDEKSSPSNSYFWLPMNVDDMTTESSNTMEHPSGRMASQKVPKHRNENMQLLAISVTAIIVIVIAAISLIAVWSQFWVAKDKNRGKRPLTDEELCRTSFQVMDEKPLWLKDMYHTEDEMQRSNIDARLHDEESLENINMGQLGDEVGTWEMDMGQLGDEVGTWEMDMEQLGQQEMKNINTELPGRDAEDKPEEMEKIKTELPGRDAEDKPEEMEKIKTELPGGDAEDKEEDKESSAAKAEAASDAAEHGDKEDEGEEEGKSLVENIAEPTVPTPIEEEKEEVEEEKEEEEEEEEEDDDDDDDDDEDD